MKHEYDIPPEPFNDEFLLVADSHGHDIYMLDTNTAEIQVRKYPFDVIFHVDWFLLCNISNCNTQKA